MKLSILSICSGLTLSLIPCVGVLSAAQVAASPDKGQSKSSSYNLHGETDDTDTYAVPLDNDQESEDEEMDMLDEMGKEAKDRRSSTNSTSPKK